MNPILSFILKGLGPYLLAFILGAVLFNGCGESNPVVEKVTIEKPTPKIEKTEAKEGRFVKPIQPKGASIDIKTIGTPTQPASVNLQIDINQSFEIDTNAIVEAWISEVAKYDTTIGFEFYDLRLTWNNYQNRTNSLTATLTPKRLPKTNGLHFTPFLRFGIISDFKQNYTPTIGTGLLFEKKRVMFGAQYGYSGQHHVEGVVGYRLK